MPVYQHWSTVVERNDSWASKSDGYIPGLDGIRAISIILVMTAHFGFRHLIPGGLGVTIFFFVSGFLITTLLLNERFRFGKISLRNFYARRFLRLSPELVILISLSSIFGIIYSNFRFYDILFSLTYTTNYYILYLDSYSLAAPRWPHLWSLAVEEHFYLTFPLMVLLFAGRTVLMTGLLFGICLGALLWRIWIVSMGPPFGLGGDELLYTYFATDTRIDSVAFGCLTAILFRGWKAMSRPQILGAVAIFVAFLLMLFSLLYRDPGFRETFRYSVQGVALMLFFFGLFTPSGSTIMKLLELPPLRYLGVLSYGAYLWHVEFALMYKGMNGQSIYDADLSTRLAMLPLGFVFTFVMAQISFSATSRLRGMRRYFRHQSTELTENRCT